MCFSQMYVTFLIFFNMYVSCADTSYFTWGGRVEYKNQALASPWRLGVSKGFEGLNVAVSLLNHAFYMVGDRGSFDYFSHPFAQ